MMNKFMVQIEIQYTLKLFTHKGRHDFDRHLRLTFWVNVIRKPEVFLVTHLVQNLGSSIIYTDCKEAYCQTALKKQFKDINYDYWKYKDFIANFLLKLPVTTLKNINTYL